MISRRSLLILMANALSAVLGYVGIFAIARFTADSEQLLGLVGFGIGFVGSFFAIAGLGLPAAHVKRVSQGEPLGQCIATFTILRVIQVAVAIGATFLAVFIWTAVLGRGFETPLHLQVISIMLLYHVATSAATIATTTFNSRLETAKSQASTFAGTVTRVVGMIIVAVAGLGGAALAWAYSLGAFAVAMTAFVLFIRYPLSRPSLGLFKSYMRFALPLSLPALLAALSVNIDKAVIQLFWGTTEVGYYFTIQRIILFLTLTSTAVSVLLFPAISRYHARDEVELLRVKSRQSERYLSMILAPVVAFLIIYPEGVIHVLLSNDFLPAADILRIFAMATFVLALIVPRQAILQGMDRSKLAGIAALAGALVTLALYLVLIPRSIFGVSLGGLGPEGAALGVMVGYGVILAVALTFSHRLVGDRIHRNVAYHILAASAVAILFSQVLSPAMGLEWQWFHLLFFSLTFLGGYLAILVAVREFRKPDLLLFLDLMDPRKMADYIREELTNDQVE